ncbi:secretin N-terminal domain-containing protein [Niveispirillum sp. KHB5.9]|uniref:secretin N-terminal domain-containing protein n=1 Tax=Niveispirillum sp. KHB5.9 TaxID=3400269 RepID=UPI003A83CB2A
MTPSSTLPRRACALLLTACLLASCAEPPAATRPGARLPVSPPAPTLSGNTVLTPPPVAGAPQVETVVGSGRFTRSAGTGGAGVGDGQPVEINLVNTDIRSAVDAVLGGMLGLNYTVDPRVQGQVTIRTSRPLPRAQALGAVDAALRGQGFAIVESGGFHQVIPLADAAAQAPVMQGRLAERAAGFVTTIVPVTQVGVADLEKVVRPLTRAGFIQQADPVRNIFIVSGTSQEVSGFSDLVASFDVDWLAGLSFAIHTLRHVEPARLETELRDALMLGDGPMKGMVEFVPLPRLNALLVATKRPGLLPPIAQWVERLDRQGPDGGRVMHYYEVQNGNAAELATALNRLTGQGGGGSSGDTDDGRQTGPASPGASPTLPAGMQLDTRVPAEGGESDTGSGDEAVDELKGVRVVADARRNALLIMGTASQFAIMEQALAKLDAPREQVLIEATIAEVSLTDDLNFGVQWFLDRGNNRVGFANASTIGPTFPGFNYSFLTPDTGVVLNTLSSVTDVQVLSAPRLMVLNNEKARLQVGDQVPIVIQQSTGVQNGNAPLVNSVEMRDTGVILEVTPRINRSGAVVLEVSQEVSSVATTTTSGIDSPTIRQRRVNSTVSIQDGETVALGGLISDSVTSGGSGIPYLRDVPVLGKLFGTDKRGKGRTELLVFLRPVIVRDAARAREVTDALRASMGRLEILADPGDARPPRP